MVIRPGGNPILTGLRGPGGNPILTGLRGPGGNPIPPVAVSMQTAAAKAVVMVTRYTRQQLYNWCSFEILMMNDSLHMEACCTISGKFCRSIIQHDRSLSLLPDLELYAPSPRQSICILRKRLLLLSGQRWHTVRGVVLVESSNIKGVPLK